jgi:hypothetical protein
VNFWYR